MKQYEILNDLLYKKQTPNTQSMHNMYYGCRDKKNKSTTKSINDDK